MNKSVKRNILVLLLLSILAIATVGYYLYNKGPVDVKNSNAIKVSAADLYKEFISDSAVALKKYEGVVSELKASALMASALALCVVNVM